MLSITCPPVADGISHVRCRAGTLSAQGGKAHSIDKEPVCLLGSKTSRFKLQAIEVHTDLARKTLRATTPHLPESWFSFKISQDLKFAGCGFTPVYWCSKWALDFEGLIFCHSGNVGPPPDPQQLQMLAHHCLLLCLSGGSYRDGGGKGGEAGVTDGVMGSWCLLSLGQLWELSAILGDKVQLVVTCPSPWEGTSFFPQERKQTEVGTSVTVSFPYWFCMASR